MKELQRWPCRKDSSSMEPGAGLASGSAHARMQSETMQKAWRRRARSARNAKCRHHACVSGDPGEPHIAAAPRNGRAPTAHRRPRECETREARARLCRFPGSIDTHHVSLAPPHPIQHPPPHAPSNPASNRRNSGRNLWIEMALGQIGPRGSRTASAGFQAPSTRIMSHLRHLTPSNTLPRLAPPHRPEIVVTQAGILGLRWRLARSGPGGPAQPLEVSRLHRHASCLTCATSPHPTPSLVSHPRTGLKSS